MRQVYLDYSATTPVKDEVLQEMLPYFTQNFGNPSSLYTKGLESKEAVDKAREQVANLIGATPKEIYFTGCGSESDNWAVFGVAEAMKDKGNHIITTKIEHHAMLHSCEFLEKKGYKVTYLDVEADGLVTPVTAPWLFIKTLRSGYLKDTSQTEQGYEISFDDSYAEEALQLQIQTAGELPVSAEIFWQGRRILTLSVEDFSIL